MIAVNHNSGSTEFPDATRVSTDEHNNLEVWGGHDGDQLVWVCAHDQWRDVRIGADDGDTSDAD